MNNFRQFILQQTGIIKKYIVNLNSTKGNEQLKGIFIKRLNRRRILNHEELVFSVQDKLSLNIVTVDQLSFLEQIQRVRNGGSVMIGMQAAGMLNALYLRKNSSIIVLFQYNAASDSFGKLFKPLDYFKYYTWVNKHIKNSFTNITEDVYHDQADTIVNVSEFVHVVTMVLEK